MADLHRRINEESGPNSEDRPVLEAVAKIKSLFDKDYYKRLSAERRADGLGFRLIAEIPKYDPEVLRRIVYAGIRDQVFTLRADIFSAQEDLRDQQGIQESYHHQIVQTAITVLGVGNPLPLTIIARANSQDQITVVMAAPVVTP